MLKDTKAGGYKIDADGVCTTDYSGRFTLTEDNLDEYCDYLLQKNGKTLEAIYDFVWKKFGQRPNEPIGNLLNPTQHEINQMIIRFFNEGGGACCDYSYATQRLLQRAGYKNVIVHCDTKLSRHQWNLVQVRPGVWRHMDTFRKAYKIFLRTDDEVAALDSKDVQTPTGTGGKNPGQETPPETTEAPKPTEPPTTQAPPETTKATEPETTQAPEPETTEAPEPVTEPETTEPEPTEPTTAEAPETTAEPETTAASETTEAPAPETTAPPETTAAPETTAPPETTAAPETTAVPETTEESEEPAPGDGQAS